MTATRVKVCLAPGKVLPGNVRKGEQDAQRFGDRIAELPIVIDYLIETNSGFFSSASRPTDTDWWDSSNTAQYKAMMLHRHPELHATKSRAAKFRADTSARVPDITTFKGRFVRRLPSGQTIVAKPGDRSEIYEIKPNNAAGKALAREKLKDVEQSYLDYGIAGIYQRGTWYPETSPKKIRYLASAIVRRHLSYLLNIVSRRFGARVVDIYQQVDRTEPGCLLYRFCVEFEREDNKGFNDLEFAKYILAEIFFPCWMIGHPTPEKEAALALAATLEPVPADVPSAPRYRPAAPGSAEYNKIPTIKMRPLEPLVDEIRSEIASIGDALYTRMLGLPGEEYLICCDETYYRTMIVETRRRRMQQQIKLVSAPSAVPYVASHPLMVVLPAVSLTGLAMVKEYATISVEALADLMKYAADHPLETIIVVSFAIAATALLVLTLGAAAPEVAALAPVVGAAASGAGGVAAGAGAVAGTEALGMAAPLMAAATTPAIAAVTAVPEVVVASEIAAAAGGAAAAEIAPVAAATEVPAIVTMARTMAADFTAKAAIEKALTDAAAKAVLRKALVGGTVMVVGLCASPAYAKATTGSGQEQGGQLGAFVAMPVGRLFVVRASQAPGSDIARMRDPDRPAPPPFGQSAPRLEKEFNYAKFTDDVAVLTEASAGGNQPVAYYLGRLRVE
jgi:hypothetical protein